MISQNTPTNVKRLAQSIFWLNTVLWLFGIVMGILFASSMNFEKLVAVVYSVLAMLIISRQSRHTVGWLFLVVGFFLALGVFSFGFDRLNTFINFEFSEPVIHLFIWVDHLAWIPAFLLPISLVLQFFPDGRLPSPRWWPITATALLGICGLMSSFAFHPWPWEESGIFDAHNPFGIPGSEGFFESLFNISIISFLIGVIGSMVSVIVRFRRSQGIERIQIKWVVYTAVVGISALTLTRLILGMTNNPISDFIFLLMPSLLAVTIGVAILRHRLFDIDIIIRRTLQYSLLTGLLTAVYFGGVALLQGILTADRGRLAAGEGAVGGPPSAVVIVITTLAIAALFNPLRRRVQDFIDRRFYRQKYNAEKALADFAAEARADTDMDRLSAGILETVQATLQPRSAGLWMVRRKEREKS
jgi:hypothetical protein